jgi:energy-coupling factor transporter ATP-binding protein EcfA2
MSKKIHKKERENISKGIQDNKFICFEDIQSELHRFGHNVNQMKDIQDLFNQMNTSSESLQIQWDKVISTKDACKIFKTITGDNLDLGKIKYFPTYFRDIAFSQCVEDDDCNKPTRGLLELEQLEDSNLFSNLTDKINFCYSKLTKEISNHKLVSAPVLGVFTFGGFLKGNSEKEDEPLLISLQQGLNIIIGDRGSGKSTTLDMIALLSDVAKEDYHENKIVDSLVMGKRKFHRFGSGKANQLLKNYGIRQYICFFTSQGDTSIIYAFYINTDRKKWSLLKLSDGQWNVSDSDPIDVFLNPMILRQGDIFRLIDSRDKLLINKIIESLDQDIKDSKQQLIDICTGMVKSYQIIIKKAEKSKLIYDPEKEADNGLSKIVIDNQSINNFVLAREKEIINISEIIEHSIYQNLNSETFNRIVELVKTYIYNYETSKHLVSGNSFLKLIKIGENGLWMIFLSDIINNLKRIYAIHQQSKEDIVNLKQTLEDLNKLFRLLYIRLKLICKICNNISECYSWNTDLNSLIKYGTSFFSNQLNLISMETDYYNSIKSGLDFLKDQEIHFSHDINIDVKLVTLLANAETNYMSILETTLIELEENHQKTTTSNKDLKICLASSDNLKKAMARLLKVLEGLTSEGAEELAKKTLINNPINIFLNQGGVFRSFEKLSYGQKSGIILSIIATTTKSKIIVVDQPEDNLDSKAISTLLIPMFISVCKTKTLVVASHNSNLVMGLAKANPLISVMALPSSYGGRDKLGRLHDQSILLSILEILEGGLEVWKQKIVFFGNFLR